MPCADLYDDKTVEDQFSKWGFQLALLPFDPTFRQGSQNDDSTSVNREELNQDEEIATIRSTSEAI